MIQSKKDLRKHMISLRESIAAEDLIKYNEVIYKKVTSSKEYIEAGTIFVYVSFKKEVFTQGIIEDALSKGKRVCVPKVISKEKGMKAISISCLEDLKPGAMGILEPDFEEAKVVSEKDIDLVLVPGTAFDSIGGRLGYGGGFYDKFLKLLREDCHKIGLGYRIQLVEEIPMDKQDVFIDKIITE